MLPSGYMKCDRLLMDLGDAVGRRDAASAKKLARGFFLTVGEMALLSLGIHAFEGIVSDSFFFNTLADCSIVASHLETLARSKDDARTRRITGARD